MGHQTTLRKARRAHELIFLLAGNRQFAARNHYNDHQPVQSRLRKRLYLKAVHNHLAARPSQRQSRNCELRGWGHECSGKAVAEGVVQPRYGVGGVGQNRRQAECAGCCCSPERDKRRGGGAWGRVLVINREFIAETFGCT